MVDNTKGILIDNINTLFFDKSKFSIYPHEFELMPVVYKTTPKYDFRVGYGRITFIFDDVEDDEDYTCIHVFDEIYKQTFNAECIRFLTEEQYAEIMKFYKDK